MDVVDSIDDVDVDGVDGVDAVDGVDVVINGIDYHLLHVVVKLDLLLPQAGNELLGSDCTHLEFKISITQQQDVEPDFEQTFLFCVTME